MFDNFDPSSLANFNEKRLRSLRESANSLLSEPKIRAIIENAKHFQKVKRTFIPEVAKLILNCLAFQNIDPFFDLLQILNLVIII